MKRHITSTLSILFGKFADKEFHPAVQRLINVVYVKLMRLDMSRFNPPQSYPSLNALFTRALLNSVDLSVQKDALIAPVDALVTQAGTVLSDTALQIKGMSYAVSELLGKELGILAKKLEGGDFVNYYLSPRDYHRYHAPCDLRFVSVGYIPGKLYPVNLPYLKKKANLFVENERVVLECYDSNDHLHILVLVGALNVGRIKLLFLPGYQSSTEPSYHTFNDPVMLERGELFGWFEMGSTLVHFTQKGAIKWSVIEGKKVQVGQVVGYLQAKELYHGS